jgi:hypothetical protein
MMPVRRWTSAIFVLALSAGLSVADPINPADVHVIDGDTIRVAGWDGPRGWVRRAQARQPRPLRVTRSPSSRSHSRPNAALPGIAVSVNSLKLVTALFSGLPPRPPAEGLLADQSPLSAWRCLELLWI